MPSYIHIHTNNNVQYTHGNTEQVASIETQAKTVARRLEFKFLHLQIAARPNSTVPASDWLPKSTQYVRY